MTYLNNEQQYHECLAELLSLKKRKRSTEQETKFQTLVKQVKDFENVVHDQSAIVQYLDNNPVQDEKVLNFVFGESVTHSLEKSIPPNIEGLPHKLIERYSDFSLKYESNVANSLFLFII